MPNNIAHFQISADDLERCRRFYERTFGWRFRPWGPPDFFMIQTGGDEDPGIHGSLTRRHEPVTGGGPSAFECTIGVDDVDAALRAVERHGGKILYPKTELPGVGTLFQFRDPEGNTVSVMQYLAGPTRGG